MMAGHNSVFQLSRRQILAGGAVSATAVTLVAPLDGGSAAAETAAKASPPRPFGMDVTLTINGARHDLTIDPRMTLLDALRERLQMTGAKKGCDHGQCGACTVLIDGRRVLSCLTLAVSTQGNAITTIEGLAASDGTLHPMQQAFIEHDGFQCGYCTPGQIMSAVGCVSEGHAESDAEIREYMSGNLCRCAAYPNIVAAIKSAKSQMRRA